MRSIELYCSKCGQRLVADLDLNELVRHKLDEIVNEVFDKIKDGKEKNTA